MDEEWRPVEGWPYEVSDYGRVRRSNGWSAGRILVTRGTGGSRKYRTVGLRQVTAGTPQRRQIMVHRLVMVAFAGHPPLGKQVNHKDGDPSNNRLVNLEYVTPSENTRHAIRTGLRKVTNQGERHYAVKLTDGDVSRIIRRASAGETFSSLAREYGVSGGTISGIVHRKTWKHIPVQPAKEEG